MNGHDSLREIHRLAAAGASFEEVLETLTGRGQVSRPCGVTLDTARAARCGQPEAVYGRGKSPEQLIQAVSGLTAAGQPVLVTKLSPEQGGHLAAHFPGGKFLAQAGLFVCGADLDLHEPWPETGDIAVIAAGASDLPVALEAYAAARFYGESCALVCDVGVAGIHRMLARAPALSAARVHVVVAGMEGALPSVVAGYFGKPVIGVPTSVGYGAAFGGLTALLAMLNACATGIAVVNIDNGFGAAALAVKILGAGRPEPR
jgi:NCAIR mutase (PurE)-related protein